MKEHDYTPVSAVPKRAGIDGQIKRSKLARHKLAHWLTREQAAHTLEATERIKASEATRI